MLGVPRIWLIGYRASVLLGQKPGRPRAQERFGEAVQDYDQAAELFGEPLEDLFKLNTLNKNGNSRA